MSLEELQREVNACNEMEAWYGRILAGVTNRKTRLLKEIMEIKKAQVEAELKPIKPKRLLKKEFTQNAARKHSSAEKQPVGEPLSITRY